MKHMWSNTIFKKTECQKVKLGSEGLLLRFFMYSYAWFPNYATYFQVYFKSNKDLAEILNFFAHDSHDVWQHGSIPAHSTLGFRSCVSGKG